MIDKSILSHPELLSQDGIRTSRLDDGLRILARIIARDLLAKRSMHAKKNYVKANDTQVSVDS
ncbi:MAG: hypothetical protein E3J66_06600 [Dehalococcoidia bacterium]|nr:MAG: hypothetical protein E3J66_06600 [Dehalococcoidia bacterium]